MKKSLTHLFLSSSVLAAAASVGVLVMAGCAGLTTTATEAPVTGAVISGHLHGGNQPISGSTVKLYAVGTSGYGSAGTLLATTTSLSDGRGSFSFSQVGSGGTGPSGSSYTCPSASTLLYLIANGGDTGSGTSNAAASFLAPVGPCGSAASVFVDMNEITTAASVYALSSYINPGKLPASESVGTSSSAQGMTGLTNAFNSVANLAAVATGAAITTNSYSGIGTASAVTVTVTPESTKLITIADVLAACVNTGSNSSNQCSDLSNNALPPASASTTSQPSATFSTAQDTVQAAYYMATNPAGNGTSLGCNSSATSTIGCLFNLVTANVAFQTPLATAPTDWTVGVTYTSTGNCFAGAPFINGAYHAAVDASGNLWFINAGGSTSGSSLAELSPTGMPLACYENLAVGRGVTIDTAGNVWAAFDSTSHGGLFEIPNGSTTPVQWPTPGNALAYTLTSDGLGNVYVTNVANLSLYEVVAPGTTTTPFALVTAATGYTGTPAYPQADGQGRIWTSAEGTTFYVPYPDPAYQASVTTVAVASGVANFTATNTFVAGQQVQFSGMTSPEGQLFNGRTLTIASASSASFTATTTAADGVGVETSATATIPGHDLMAANHQVTGNSYAVAIDAANNVYQGTTCCGSGSPLRALVKWVPGAAGTATATLSGSSPGGINGVRSLTTDGAGNLWVGNEYASSPGSTTTTGQFAVMEFTTTGSGTSTFTPLSPPATITQTSSNCTTTVGCPSGGGFYDADFGEPYDMEVDPSGNLWVLNTYVSNSGANATSITELIGAAVPVATPLSTATANNQLGTKP